MTLNDVKESVREFMHLEDEAMIDVALSCMLCNRLKVGDPVWLMLIGPSSSGKSQILRPLALSDERFIHRVDDITENTFLSGGVAKGGKDVSLLKRIGPHGMITISDLTVLFSKNSESRNAILSQFRMLYDGEMHKIVGNRDASLVWKGYLGVISGGTPSIYSGFEEVADMGERFLCYRMKPFDSVQATEKALKRGIYGKELDKKLAEIYGQYLKEVTKAMEGKPVPVLSDSQLREIIEIADFAEKIRTINRIDRFTKEIERIPTPAMPMRTALQLANVARGLMLMGNGESFDMGIIRWLGFSLANEEKRAVLDVLSGYGVGVGAQTVADKVGLDTRVVRVVLQNLASVGVVRRTGMEGSLMWEIHESHRGMVEKITGKSATLFDVGRAVTMDEYEEEMGGGF